MLATSKGVLTSATIACLVVLAVSCSKSGGDSQGGGNPAQVSAGLSDFLLRPTQVPELFAFSAELDELRLVESDGTQSANLLVDPLPLEFLHLEERHAWLSRAILSKDASYSGVMISFTPESYEAIAQDGTALAVEAISDDFTADIVGGAGDLNYARFEVLLDLFESLTFDTEGGSVSFDPQGSTRIEGGSLPAELDETLGLVTLRDPGVEALEMTAFASQELKALIGPVRVRIHPSAALVLTDNNMLQSASFFLTYMTPGATLVNVSGSLGVGGELLASRVELEDQVPIVGGVFPVCMEGRVVELGTNHNLGLLVRSIPRGRQIVQPYLDGLADPSTLLVTYDPTSVLIFVDDDQQVSPLELSPGQEIALKFRSFQGEPFLSWRMSIASDG